MCQSSLCCNVYKRIKDSMDFAGFEPALLTYFYANKPPVWKVQKKRLPKDWRKSLLCK